LTPEEITALRKALNEDVEIRNKRVKFLYLAQKGTQPPVFTLGVKDAGVLNQNTKNI